MYATAPHDLDRMRSNLLFDGPDAGAKLSKFWVLLVLASCIAAAGVVGDSTATVIGAMIVAPLMTPIMGTVLSITTSDRANLVRSVALVAAGAATGIAIGYLFGLLSAIPVVADTSTQVAGRVHPRMIDLLAAVATGAVGAFAQCREDVSDTLPGVAIAISLVPPLTVVGLTLEGGRPAESWGAMLLFLTNVAAILLTGVVVMALFGVHRLAAAESSSLNRTRAVIAVVVFVVVVSIPLMFASVRLTNESSQLGQVRDVTRRWAAPSDWIVADVTRTAEALEVVVSGPLPAPKPADLRAALDDAGLGSVGIVLRMVPEQKVRLPGD